MNERPIVVTVGTELTRTRITLAAEEVRVKFPDARNDGVDRGHAFKFARALEASLRDAEITLRGRIYPAGDGLRVTLFNGNSRFIASYRFGAELEEEVLT